MTFVHKLASGVVSVGARLHKRKFREFTESCNNSLREQDRTLMRIIYENKDTAFGTSHDFKGIRNIEGFQNRVPISDYDYHLFWIEKIMAGQDKQLTSQPVQRFVTTSGTTSACKFIPITSQYIEDYRQATALWCLGAFGDHPKIAGRVLTIASSIDEGVTEAGIPYGAVSGLMQKRQMVLSKILGVAGSEISSIKDADEKNYTLARVALEENLTYIHTANPLTILNLMKTIDCHADDLIRDIHDGKIPVRKRKSQKQRASSLGRMIDTGTFSPENYWPDLALIGCWTGGTQYLFLEQLKKYFPKVAFRDIGLLASEGRMTLPLRDNTSSGVLNITKNFFEFIPEGEIDSENPNILETVDLEIDKNYFLVLTTNAGLYRYSMGDLVKVTGFLGNTPEVAFLGKGAHVSNITGEKLTEYQVVRAYHSIMAGGMPDKFILFPKVEDGKARYVIASPSDFSSRTLEALDRSLQDANMEYKSRRDGGKLGSLECMRIEDADFRRVSQVRLIPGKEAQFKHNYLGKINLL